MIICDENGAVLDGDQLMAMIGEYWHAHGLLKGGGVVATQMSNLGLERFFAGLGLTLVRTKVGDRYVVEHMRKHGFNVGGEQSGHMVLSDYATTGDGLIAGLQVLAVMLESNQPLSLAGKRFTPLPQLLKNVRYSGSSPLQRNDVQDAIKSAEKALGAKGRVFVRPSGTEKLIRVMAEGEDSGQVKALVDGICQSIESRVENRESSDAVSPHDSRL